jgi:hypothetical protein
MSSLSAANAVALVSVVALTLSSVACAPPPPPPRMSSSSSSSEGFASCPAGSTVVGGGYEIEVKARMSGRLPVVVSSRPTETGWKVECVDGEGKTVAGCKAYVLCATVL